MNRPASQSGHTPSSLNSARRVMIVEDEQRLREMLVRAVTDMGFEASGVASGEAALRAAVDERPAEIVILDLNLPGIDGISVFEALRKKDPALQVIVLTGFGDLGAAQRAIHLDAVDFLTKPCPLGELEVALERARSRRVKAMNPQNSAPPEPAPRVSGSETSLETMERNHILAVLARNNGNRTATAAELGISLRKLYYRLGQYQREGLVR